MSEPETCMKPAKCCCRCLRWILIVVAAAVVLVLLCHLFHPATFTSTAYIQILSQKPYFIYPEEERKQYDRYVETQFAIMRSPLIIEKALEDPVVAQLASVKRQPEKVAWLSKKLELRRVDGSEMVTVSISLRNQEEPDKIVNAVVNAYFDYCDTQSNEWNHKLIMQLNLEYNRQQAAARLLRDEIRSAMELAAKQGGVGDDVLPGPAQNEALLKDIYQSELKLAAFQAELKALRETLKEGPIVPATMIENAVTNDPEMNALLDRKTELQKQIEQLKAVMPRDDDPKIVGYEKRIQELDKTIRQQVDDFASSKGPSIQRQLRAEMEKQIMEKEVFVRAQEILVAELKSKYKQQLADIGKRTMVVDVSFQQRQLERYDKVLDLLQERITKLETERHAPEQIQLRKRATAARSERRRCCFR